MKLSQREQRELTAIARQLSVEDPALSRLITDWPDGPSESQRARHKMVIPVWVLVLAGLLCGAILTNGRVRGLLVVSTVLAVSAAGVCLCRAFRRRAGSRPVETEPSQRTVPPWWAAKDGPIGWWWY